MRIKTIRIQKFRSFKDLSVALENFTSLVGPNGAGKSTILCALNIFFREIDGTSTSTTDLDEEDFHNRDTSQPIEITVAFCDLKPEAQTEFSEYYRQGELIITAKATFDAITGSAIVRQYGQRRAMEAFKSYFEAYNGGRSAADCKAEFDKIRAAVPGVTGAASKDAMRDALRAYEEAHPAECVLIPSEDQFYGFSKGANRLAKHVQWVYVPAVKDATKENVEGKNTALGKILARTVRAKVKFDEEIKKLKDETLARYRDLLKDQQGALDDISKALSRRLGEWAHPEATARLSWAEDVKKSVQVEEPIARLLAGEGAFEGELARFGHGLQRSYLLALLQELAAADDPDAPRLLLGCEEPELYQHPPQAKHLATVLQTLADGNAQVVVSTHSPYFVSGRYFESVRMVRRDAGKKYSNVSAVSFDDLAAKLSSILGEGVLKADAQMAKLHQAMQPHLNEMFFAPKLIFVEGLEDLAYINAWMMLSGRWEDYRRYGAQIVPTNGKGYIIEPLVIADMMGIPRLRGQRVARV
ncbi:MAG: ATP-dependent nuclease [Rhabdaerophilum sp.]